MAYKRIAEQEKEFVEEILASGGIRNYAATDQGRRTYYEFRLQNGTTRYWVNMSSSNLRKLEEESPVFGNLKIKEFLRIPNSSV